MPTKAPGGLTREALPSERETQKCIPGSGTSPRTWRRVDMSGCERPRGCDEIRVLATAKREFYVERTDARKEREQLLDLLASQQRVIESQASKPKPTLFGRLFGRRQGASN